MHLPLIRVHAPGLELMDLADLADSAGGFGALGGLSLATWQTGRFSDGLRNLAMPV